MVANGEGAKARVTAEMAVAKGSDGGGGDGGSDGGGEGVAVKAVGTVMAVWWQ